MRVFIILGLLLLSACGAKRSTFVMGETTRADVLADKGEPLSEETPPVKDVRVMIYENNEKIQLKNDVVTNRFTNPSGNQKLVMWWKHKFKDCATTTQQLAHDPKSHTPPEMELSCRSEGLSVIYTQGSDIISRVVENEKK